ncbi:TerB N-terminal domain-containing protein [Paenibacillus lemnae]|uniref:TerB-C domain-containing protein n=1 Tax=Paenibacillus lemnae TaxID=1330551 RepID=A0A848MB03_PAELE|nr:TerB N-terminal domain-containing protein [Paenibacillus lemnae]NMO97153.1 hypothetical protein [Paenibacillus lemnae]
MTPKDSREQGSDSHSWEVSRTSGSKGATGQVRHKVIRDLQMTFAEFELGGEERQLKIPEHAPAGHQDQDEGVLAPKEAAPGELTLDDLNAWEPKNVWEPENAGDPEPEKPPKGTVHAKPSEVSSLPPSSVPPSFDGVRYYSREQQFYMRARELEWHVEQEGPFVPFKSYWPVYSEMLPSQESWYFYWREEVRSGRYPDTDLSYLFVYIYELIHGIGWSAPEQGRQLMQRIWSAYRDRYRKLDSYMREWLFDFDHVHGLMHPSESEEGFQKIPRNLSPELKEREWRRRFTAQPLELNWDVLKELLDIDPEKSRFVQEAGRKEMRVYAPKVISMVDAYLEKTGGTRLLERFSPPEVQSSRTIFRTAVYDEGLYGRTVMVPVVKISTYAPLRAYLTQLVRLTENRLRELMGFKGRLKGVAVEPEIDKLVTRYLKRELNPEEPTQGKPSVPEVAIDMGKLQRLQRESDEVRDLLLIPDSASGLEQVSAEPVMVEGSLHLMEENCPGNRQAAVPRAKVQDAAAEPGERVPAEMGAGAGAEAEAEAEADSGKVYWNTEDLDEDWQELARALTPAHLDMLYGLKEGLGSDALQAAAQRAGSMPELLIDEINEAAMSWIGDLLIDGDALTEDYVDMLDFIKR